MHARWPIIALVGVALAGCGAVVTTADHAISRSQLGAETGVVDEDMNDLRSGRIDRVRDRYERQPIAALSGQQRALLCDILIKYRDFGAAQTCLSRDAGGASADGKRALIALALGDADAAAALTEGSSSTGGRYVHALAEARLGRTDAARRTADDFSRRFEPETVYFAANLYAAVNDSAASLRTLQDPERRLLRDYGVVANQTLLGRADLAPFHLDVFDEFGYGLFKTFSYAPAANVYVEYLAAHALLELGRGAEASPRYDALLAYPGIGNYRDVLWLILFDRGRLAERAGRGAEAREDFRRSIELIESMRRSVASDEGRIGFVADKQAVYAAMVASLVKAGQTEAALDYSERARSRSLVDMLASRNDILAHELSPSASQAVLGSLRREEGEADLASAAPSAGERGAGRRPAAGLRDAVTRAPSLAPLISVSPVQLSTIRSALGADETAIAYFRAGDGWLAFVLSRTTLDVVPLQADGVDRIIAAFLRGIVSGHGQSASGAELEAARSLYTMLIRPLEPFIRTRRLALVPQGTLHYIPFAALHDGNGFLIQKYSIRTVPSLSTLMIAAPSGAGGSGSLVIGNPSRGNEAASLPYAEKEAVSVEKVLPSATLLLGADATLERFTSLSANKAFIHIASHGQFDPKQPLASRLLLTPSAASNGDLTVAAVYSLRLNADLVTLSACQTAISQVANGDDLVGLVRGFLFAGTRNVVATLWDVSDEATGALMVAFYQALKETGSVPDALQRAQLATMQKYPAPFYWAAFVATSFSPRVGRAP